MMADYPSAYRQHPLTEVVASIPDSWDDTVAITGEVGNLVAVARRIKDDWWIGALTNREPRELSMPLDFLGPQKYHATIYQDDPSAKNKYREMVQENLSADDVIDLSLGEAGGALIHLRP